MGKLLILLLLLSCKREDPALDLGYIIAAECMQCDSMEKVHVGETVVNRLNHPDYPKDIRSIIIDGYKGYCHEWYIYDKQCYEIAQKLINNVPRDTQILFFYSKFDKKPRYIKHIKYKEDFHNFGY